MLEDTYLYKEIHEQPQVLKSMLENERQAVEALAAEIKRRDIHAVTIAARGTSDNAGRYAQYLLGAVNGLLVGLATPSLFTIYKKPPRFGNSLVSAQQIVDNPGLAPQFGAGPAYLVCQKSTTNSEHENPQQPTLLKQGASPPEKTTHQSQSNKGHTQGDHGVVSLKNQEHIRPLVRGKGVETGHRGRETPVHEKR